FFLAISYTLRVNGHMSVDLLTTALQSVRVRTTLRVVGDVLALVLFAALIRASSATAWTAWSTGEVDPQALSLPVWWSRALVPLGCGLLALRLALRIADGLWLIAQRPRQSLHAGMR
ncbi:MAG: TRAP transporter small permease, partial [Casimicrobiaceae bacterium]